MLCSFSRAATTSIMATTLRQRRNKQKEKYRKKQHEEKLNTIPFDVFLRSLSSFCPAEELKRLCCPQRPGRIHLMLTPKREVLPGPMRLGRGFSRAAGLEKRAGAGYFGCRFFALKSLFLVLGLT